MSTVGATTRSRSLVNLALRLVVVAGLLVDAVIHLRLAPEYAFAFPEGIGGGNVFRIEAAAAILVAIAVLLVGRSWTFLLAFLVAASAAAAVVLSVYVELPAVGPLPSMYEPLWFAEKTLSAVAEAIAALAALVGFVVARRHASTGAHTLKRNVPAGR